MTAPHDTPEAVEAMATWNAREAATLRAHHVDMGSMPELAEMHENTAAMLRRLHQRAVDAERERDENHRAWRDSVSQSDDLRLQRDEARQRIHDLEVVVENWRGLLTDTRAALATARADSLRAALKIARDAIPTASPPQTDHYGAHVAGERAAAERIVQRLAALIPATKESPHGR